MRLNEELDPLFTKHAIQNLFKKKIYSVENFMSTEPDVLARISGLSFKSVIQLKLAMASKLGAKLRNGEDLFNAAVTHGAIIPSGIQNLDKLLDGGFQTGNLYELCGGSASGKTQICFTICANITVKNYQVLYIDTKNDILMERIVQIIEAKTQSTKIGEQVNKIKICHIKNVYELLSLLDTLKANASIFRFIIIDSLTAIFYTFLGEKQREGLAILNSVTNILQFIANTYQTVVLVTNLVTKWLADETLDGKDDDDKMSVQKPALGKYWAHVPNTRINTQRLGGLDELLVTIVKCSHLPIGKTAKLIVTAAGVS